MSASAERLYRTDEGVGISVCERRPPDSLGAGGIELTD
jgi:hypothetical protein